MTTDKHENTNSPRLRVPAKPIAPAAAPAAPTGAPEGGKGGKGGDRPPPAVTNREFVAAIFSTLPEGASPLILAKPGNPNAGGWGGFPGDEVEGRCGANSNNYVNCASFFPEEDGNFRALEAQAAAYHCLVLDDVGKKTPLDALPLIEPTWMLETSPDNFQVGFLLATPVTDFDAVKAAQKRVFGAGLGDKGAGGVGRWIRLPNGINGKPKYKGTDGTPFRCRLAEWNPEPSYELDQLVELLSPAADEATTTLASPISPAERPPALAHPSISSDVFRPAAPENPVVAALKAAGLYKGEASPGRHDVTCPWVEEHTDRLDDGACFFEPSPDFPLGGFKCHHSHGEKYRLQALLERLGLARRDLHNKPCIRVVEGEFQSMVDAAQVVLARTGEFFQSGGLIKRVVVDGSTGQATAVTQTDADLTLALSRACDWERCETKSGTVGWRRCNPHPTCIRLLVQSQVYDYLPLLRGIARQPTIDGNGNVVSVSGYDTKSQLYCAFDPSKYLRRESNRENAAAALSRLSHLVREFHFAKARDRTTTLPKADLSPIATYGGRWTEFCRQPLVWLGLEDPATGLIEQLQDDPDLASLGGLLQAWHAQYGDKPVTLRALLSDPDGELPEAIEDLPSVGEGNLISRRSRMGQ